MPFHCRAKSPDSGNHRHVPPCFDCPAYLRHTYPGLFARAVLKALATALKGLLADDENAAGILIELTEQGLGKTPAADLWRHLMAADLSFFQSQTAQSLRGGGRAEDILLLLGQRGIEVCEEDRERIVGCADLEMLSTWFARAISATSTAEVFMPTESGPRA